MPSKEATARRTIKKLKREESRLISKHRELRDVHEHKQSKAIKKQASKALVQADKPEKRAEKLKSTASGKRV